MKDYKKMSTAICDYVGGRENVIRSYYCMTRLRLILKDKERCDIEGLKEIEGVSGVKNQQGQIQVIIGPDVNKLHEEFIQLCPDQESETDVSITEEPLQKENAFNRITAFIAGIFIPLVPCLAGAGIISAVLSCFTYFGWMNTESDMYIVLNLIQNAVFYFLPFLAGLGAAKQFKTNEFYAIVMAGVLMSPVILTAIGNEVTSYSIFGIPMMLTDCSSTVIPIVLSVALMKYVKDFFDKVIPSALRIMLSSGLTFLVTAIVTLIVFAPIGTVIGNGVSFLIDWSMSVSSILGGAILGGIHLVLVITGSHFIEIPLIVQEFSSGAGTAIMPITSMGNMALVGSLLALIIKVRANKKRAEYSSLMIPTVMGITEPVLYGVAVVLKVPLIASVVGGAVGGAILATSGFKLTMMGIPGIFAAPVSAALGVPQGIWFCIAMIVSILIAFIITYFFYKPRKEGAVSNEKI